MPMEILFEVKIKYESTGVDRQDVIDAKVDYRCVDWIWENTKEHCSWQHRVAEDCGTGDSMTKTVESLG